MSNRKTRHPGDERAERLGPKAAEDDGLSQGRARALTLRMMLPNAITAAALCAGLTGVRFALNENWTLAVFAVILAGLLDGIDGRIARLLKAQSRFGAELDSLADSLSFGVAPALIVFMWSLESLPRLGWFAALAYAIACALRLARFNAQIDVDDQPHKLAGFLTGVPAPVGAGLAFFPFYLWMATGDPSWREPALVAVWMVVVAGLMISNLATLSWSSLRPRRPVRLLLIGAAALVVGALLIEPWWTFAAIGAAYLLLMPYALWRYARVKRQRQGQTA